MNSILALLALYSLMCVPGILIVVPTIHFGIARIPHRKMRVFLIILLMILLFTPIWDGGGAALIKIPVPMYLELLDYASGRFAAVFIWNVHNEAIFISVGVMASAFIGLLVSNKVKPNNKLNRSRNKNSIMSKQQSR